MIGLCRLGVASSCDAVRGSVNRQVRDQRPLWSMAWQGRCRGCSDFYPAAEVSLGAGLLLLQRFPVESARCVLARTMTARVAPDFQPSRIARQPVADGVARWAMLRCYLILVSLKTTCLRAIGSYLRKLILSVAVRGFFLVT